MVSYQVIVYQLQHRPGTRDVVQSGVYEDFVEIKDTSVTGLGNKCLYKSKETVLHEVLNICSCRGSLQCHSEGPQPGWMWSGAANLLLHTGRR